MTFTTTLFFETQALLPILYKAFSNSCVSATVFLLLTIALLLSRIIILELREHQDVDQALLTSRVQTTANTFTTIRLRDLRRSYWVLNAEKVHLANHVATRKKIIGHLHTQLCKAVDLSSRLDDELSVLTRMGFRAVAANAALKASAIALERHLCELKHQNKELKAEKRVFLRIIGVSSYAEFMVVDVKRTAQYDILRSSHSALKAVQDQLKEERANLTNERAKCEQLERELARLHEYKEVATSDSAEIAAFHSRLNTIVGERDQHAEAAARAAAKITLLFKDLVEAKDALLVRDGQLSAQRSAYSDLERIMEVKKQKYDAYWAQADDCVREANRVAEEKEAMLSEAREANKKKEEIVAMLQERITRLQTTSKEPACAETTPVNPRDVLLSPPVTPPTPSPAPLFVDDFQLQQSPPTSPGAGVSPITDRYRPMLLASVLLRQAFRVCKVPTPPAAVTNIETFAQVLPQPVSPKYHYPRRGERVDGRPCGIPGPKAGRVEVDYGKPLVPRSPRQVAQTWSSRIPIRFEVF